VALLVSEESRTVVAKGQVSCDLEGETAILNLKNGLHYGLNTVGARIWNLIQTPRTLAEIRTILLNEYNVDAPQLEQDMARLFRELSEHNLAEVAGP
jgi:hypothetical protein